jgi:hypothetical protein
MDFFEFQWPRLGSWCNTTEAVSLEILQLNNEIYRSKMQASLLDSVTLRTIITRLGECLLSLLMMKILVQSQNTKVGEYFEPF